MLHAAGDVCPHVLCVHGNKSGFLLSPAAKSIAFQTPPSSNLNYSTAQRKKQTAEGEFFAFI